MTTDSNFFDGLPCHLVMLLDIASVSGDTVYHITYYASDVYMLEKTGYIYIYIYI